MIESERDFPPVIYLQWKDDDGELIGDVTWCLDRIYEDDIVYRVLDELKGGEDADL